VCWASIGWYFANIKPGQEHGLSTTNLDLGIINITFGFNVNINLAAAVGLLIAIILYQRF